MTRLAVSPRLRKVLIAVAVALLHVLAVLFLVRAFAPGILPEVVENTLSAVAFEVPQEPPPPVEQTPVPDEGAAGAQGERATPKAVTAPEPKVRRSATPAPRASSTGSATRSGGADSGDGTGASGAGEGTGSGRGGGGRGGVLAVPPRLVASISDSSLFPPPPGGREARIGTRTVVQLTVSAEGRVTGCRILQSSGFPETDARLCQLAPTHIRFDPARDRDGNPIAAAFNYQQRYHQ